MPSMHSGSGLGGVQLKLCSSGLVVNNSAALVNIPQLSFDVGINSYWAWWAGISYMADAAADLRIDITVPAGAGGIYTDGIGNDRAYGTNWTAAGVGVAVEHWLVLSGYLNPGANAGTFQMLAAQWTPQANNMTISIGSWLAYQRIG